MAPSDWKTSAAKALLKRSFEDPSSNFLSMTWKEIYDSNVLFQQYPYTNFQRNAKRLRDKVLADRRNTNIANNANTTGTPPLRPPNTNTHPMPTAAKPPSWRSSVAKEMLRQEFLNPDSNIHKMTAEEVYASNKAVFGVYPLANFKTNFASLKDKVARDGALAAAENEMFEKIYKPLFRQQPAPLAWHTHPAKNLLRADAAEGRLDRYKPKDLWNMRQEYRAFSLDVFRKHFFQQKYKLLADTYWVMKRNKLAQRKRELEAQKMIEDWVL